MKLFQRYNKIDCNNVSWSRSWNPQKKNCKNPPAIVYATEETLVVTCVYNKRTKMSFNLVINSEYYEYIYIYIYINLYMDKFRFVRIQK